MKKVFFLLIALSLASCEGMHKRKISSEEILSQETRELNWHEVDNYPAFEECRRYIDEENSKRCFGEKVAAYFYAHLDHRKPVVTTALHDTIFLHLKISETGHPKIDSMEIDSIVSRQLPEIASWLEQSVDSLTKIYPATKRGIPVVTTFRMPIVIQAE